MALIAPVSSSQIESVSPADLSTVGTVPVADPDGIHAIVARARGVSASWSATPVAERRRHLLAVRAALAARGEEIVETLVAETGKPASDAWQELLVGAMFVDYAAKSAGSLLAPQRFGTWPYVVKRARVEYSPYGVIATITPWNWPVGISMQTLPFALAAGNVVVNKPSEYTPLTGQVLADVINSAGVELVHVVHGDGRAGAELIGAGVDKVAFTGSGQTATKVLEVAARHLVPVVMELGGKDAMIVCDDADLGQAAKAGVAAGFANAGQTCAATERIIVHDAVYDEFISELLDVVRSVRTGPGPVDHCGAIVRPQQLALLEERIADAVRKGATVLAGGHRLGDMPGWYFEPTVVADVPPDADLLTEESFGPVVSVLRARDDDHAVELANATEFGLNASVYSRSLRRGRAIGRRLVTGGVHLNDVLLGAAIPNVPFGGEKASGFGRVQGAAGLREFSRSQSVIEPRAARLPGLTPLLLSGTKPTPDQLRRTVGALYGGSLRARINAIRGR